MTSQNQVKLTDIIAPSFYDLHWDILDGKHTYYVLDGGRGSTKSSLSSAEIILGMMDDGNRGDFTNAACFRRYANTLSGSVFEQLLWAIDKLGVRHLWHATISPLKITYRPTGQVILFRGADKVKKSKSIKVSRGYIKYLWFEELDEFETPEKIRSIEQSVVRGGDKFTVFYTFNPPKSARNWVNDPVQWNAPGTMRHHSTYLTVPPSWNGEIFIAKAEHLKTVNPEAYRHEYLGEAVGTGAEVFRNLTNRRITGKEIAAFEQKRRGLDYGYASDPAHYTELNYDRKHKRLHIYAEIHAVHMSNMKLSSAIRAINPKNDEVIADSAEQKSIDQMRDEHGLRIKGAKKWPGSVDFGVKFLSEELEEIIIDAERCPNTWREFYGYELKRDINGNLLADYPDKDNHSIDAVRYALNDDMVPSGGRIVNIKL